MNRVDRGAHKIAEVDRLLGDVHASTTDVLVRRSEVEDERILRRREVVMNEVPLSVEVDGLIQSVHIRSAVRELELTDPILSELVECLEETQLRETIRREVDHRSLNLSRDSEGLPASSI
jgi:hypothetical protein